MTQPLFLTAPGVCVLCGRICGRTVDAYANGVRPAILPGSLLEIGRNGRMDAKLRIYSKVPRIFPALARLAHWLLLASGSRVVSATW